MNKPPLISIDFQSIGQFDKESAFFEPASQTLLTYWTDGNKVYWRANEVAADLASFVCLSKIFAKDNRHCFLHHRKLQKADVATFTALNNCYAKDKQSVWTVGGRFEPADIESFEVCDDGVDLRRSRKTYHFKDGTVQEAKSRTPCGYARDKHQVYLYDYWGKTKIVAKADSQSFVSNGDSNYGKDATHVFHLQKIIKGANPSSWRLIDLDNGFSRDERSIFRLEKRWAEADVDSFRLETLALDDLPPMAYPRDKDSFFLISGQRATLQQVKDEACGN